MSATTLPQPPSAARGTGRVVAIVAGALIALLAAALLLAGGAGLWADSTQRDADGWLDLAVASLRDPDPGADRRRPPARRPARRA